MLTGQYQTSGSMFSSVGSSTLSVYFPISEQEDLQSRFYLAPYKARLRKSIHEDLVSLTFWLLKDISVRMIRAIRE